MKLRNFILGYSVSLSIFHIVWIVLYLVESQYLEWLSDEQVPKMLCISVNFIAATGVGILIYGTLSLRSNVILFWLVYQVLLWHVPFLLFFLGIIGHNLGGSYGRFLRGARHFRSSDQKLQPYQPLVIGVSFSLWLCVWSMLLIRAYKFYKEVHAFRKLPEYVQRHSGRIRQTVRLSYIGDPETTYLGIPINL